MNRFLNILIPLVDHLYIFQLFEYQAGDFFRWFLRFPLKRNLQRKQRIVLTMKARALLVISFLLIVVSSLFISTDPIFFLIFLIVLMQISPLFILIADLLFKPLEEFQKKRIVQAAIAKRQKFRNLQVIAIVGSYAKTSTKNMLYTLLWKDCNVVKTPKSYNTELSIARSILTDLKETTEVYICEMDAYHPGEITQLCRIAQPTAGVITAIGPQHLERFGSMEKLAKTQFELADFLKTGNNTRHSRAGENLFGKETQKADLRLREDDGGKGNENIKNGPLYSSAALQNDKTGTLFVNHQDEWSVKIARGLDQKIVYFNNKDYSVSSIKEYPDHQTFTLHLGNEKAEIKLPIKGVHNATNFLTAAVIAHSIGISVKTIQKRAELILPTDHRLEIKRQGTMIILDNTYNANPKAALASLALLGSYKDTQKILVTPGFVELGKDHFSAHVEFGKAAAMVADDVVIVGEHAKEPLVKGLLEAGFREDKIHIVDTTTKALSHISQISSGRPVTVLLENDLPDQYF